MSLLLVILGLVLFVGLVIVHEFGHFIAARRSGVDVEEFGIGFPPKLKTMARKNGTAYTLNLLPLGGFVRLKGEHDASKGKGTYGAASDKNKIKIMLAGVGMNLATCLVMFTLLAIIGIPRLVDNQFSVSSDTKIVKQDVLVAYVQPGSPAEQAGLQPQDKLVSINNSPKISREPDLQNLTKQYAGQQVNLQFERSGKIISKTANLRTTQEIEDSKKTDSPKGYLGITPAEYVVQRSTWSAPIVAVGLAKQLTQLTLKALGSMIMGIVHGSASEATAQVTGPVGIFTIIKDGSLLGYQFILMLIAIISLTLAIMNVLPIPALDGGRLFVTLLYRVLKKPLNEHTEDRIHGTGFAVLMVLFVLITIVDVQRFF